MPRSLATQDAGANSAEEQVTAHFSPNEEQLSCQLLRWVGREFQSATCSEGKQVATKAKSARIVYRVKNKCLVQVLEVWRDRTAEEKQMRAKARKVVHRLMNGALVSTFERWRDQIIEEKQMRAKAR